MVSVLDKQLKYTIRWQTKTKKLRKWVIMKNTEKIGYQQIFRQKDYCKIMMANMINRLGDSIDAVAFTWLVYEITGSATWSAIIFALNMLPTIILQPFTGAIVERRSKKAVMVISDLIRGVVVVALVGLYTMNRIQPWIMAAFTLIISSVEAFCIPASTAIIPLVLEEEQYEYGVSLNSALSTLMQLIGTAIAGIIIGVFGIAVAISMDAVTFFGSALIKWTLKTKEEISKDINVVSSTQYFADLKEGFRYMKGKQILLNFCMLAFLVNAMLVPVNSLLAPLVSDVLGQGSELLSVIGTVLAVGMGVGSVVFLYLSKKGTLRNRIMLNGIGLAVFVGILPLGGSVKENTVAVYINTIIATLGIGFFASILSTILNVQFLKSVEQDYLARAESLLSAGAAAAMPITSILLGIMVNYVSVKDVMLICSFLCAILFIGFRMANIKVEEEYEEENHALQSD